jgi:tetratricopeptide (TPR) repeat protein
MPTIAEALTIAIRHHQAGRLQAAEQIYRQILAVEPNQADAWHWLGVVNAQSGNHQRAIECIHRALAVKPDWAEAEASLGNVLREQGKLDEAVAVLQRALARKPDFALAHNNLGVAFKHQGKRQEAVACYRRALELKPGFAEAHSNLGDALNDQGEWEEAAACCRRALELKPGLIEAYNNLGNALKGQGKLDEAAACYRRAVALKPDYAEAHNNLGNALNGQGKLDEAAACYRRALELKPDHAEAHGSLADALKDQGKLDEAAACCRRVLELKPDSAAAHNNLGGVLKDQGKLDEAVACYRRALELEPDFAQAHNNLGAVFHDQGKFDEALACYGRALELKPDYANAHHNRSLVRLLVGDFQHGWPEYEWRWRTKGYGPLPFRQPLWDGRPLQGGSILLFAEQGLGDVIQFARYAALLKASGARVIVGCQEPLLRLLARCCGIDALVGPGDDLPAIDVCASLLSLPGIFHTSLETIPADIPYLSADRALVERWREELTGIAGFKIGIAWQGSPTYRADRDRSIPLACFEPLARCRGVRLLSLQKKWGAEQLHEIAGRFPVTDLGARLDETAGAFMDTAAVMMSLDLVITSDSAIAHLAGALGVPVWVALPLVPDWRWLLDRRGSPWYPTMRLFRQKKAGNWAELFEEIKAELCAEYPRAG